MLTPPGALLALLFTKSEPLAKKDASKMLGCNHEDLGKVVLMLHESLAGTGLTVIETESELELRTAPETSEIVKSFREDELARDLGKGSLETLAVIAYKSDVTRGEIDWVRGVNSSASLRTLLMRGLIVGNESSHDKRRICYSLTTEALAHLGITGREDLPRREELRAKTEAVLDEKDTPTEDVPHP